MISKNIFSAFSRAPTGLLRYWLPSGLFLFLSGLFLAQSSHSYKVIINYTLMLPSLLACLLVSHWWPVLQRAGKLYAMALIYLFYMAGNAYLQNHRDGFEYLVWSFYIAVFLLAMGYCMEISQRQLGQILFAAVLVAATAAAYAIVHDYITDTMRTPNYRLIGYGPLYNPLRSGHLFGAFLVIAVWCALSSLISLNQRRIAACAAVVIFIAILLTNSRAPLSALAVVAVSMTIGNAPARYRWHYLALIASVSGLSIALFWTRMIERGLSLRPELWRLSLIASAQHPWLGAGLGDEFITTASNGIAYHDPHNVFLAALYYGGVVGLLLFAGLFGSAFYTAWKRRRESALFALAAPLQLFGAATLQFDGGNLLGRPSEFWILYWLPLAITFYTQRKSLAEIQSGINTTHA